MSYWTLLLLSISIGYLAYRHPTTIMDYLPQWLRPRTAGSPIQKDITNDGEHKPMEPSTADTSGVQIVVGEESEANKDSTPKAKPAEPAAPVPSLSLDGETQEQTAQPSLPSAKNISQTSSSKSAPAPAQSMPPPPKPASSLMPPPSRPNKLQPPSSASGLRVPSSGLLPNRGPPFNSQQRVSGGLTANGVVDTPNPRGKVLLSPGHSPMDWAALARSSNLSGVPSFQRVTPSMLKSMTGRKGKPAWSSWQGKVYNITPYLDFHPGGRDELMKGAGRDGTKLFMEVHPWVNWENMLESCLVGVLVSEGHVGTELEDID